MGDFWKPTAEMFSSLFERPKMAQKLLEKPPFKYLFDIITQTTKVTGFAKGLYLGDELSAEFYTQKDRKVTYLQKVITLTQLMSGQELAAKPLKIVAGLEPEHTNTFLQAMYKVAVSGNSSDPFVKKILGGGKQQEKPPAKKESKPQPKPEVKQEPKQEPPKKQQPVKVTEPVKQPQPKQEKSQERPDQKKGAKLNMKQQKEPQKKLEAQPIVQEKKPQLRPPSAKIKPGSNTRVPEQPKPQPPPPVKEVQKIIDEDQDQKPIKSNTNVKPEIKASDYSKNVREVMQEQQKETQQTEANQEPVNKINFGKLKKAKKQTKIEGGGVVSSGGQITEKQIELVKNMIQTICQNSTPLGKSIEFINDDIQSMNQELLFWRKQYTSSKTKMQNQLKITQDALVPLYDKLAQIEQQIKDQKGKIQNVKSQIIKNQSTIRDLLYSVVTTKS